MFALGLRWRQSFLIVMTGLQDCGSSAAMQFGKRRSFQEACTRHCT
jgi:hypothetical protein